MDGSQVGNDDDIINLVLQEQIWIAIVGMARSPYR